jgi:hypothetical protein
MLHKFSTKTAQALIKTSKLTLDQMLEILKESKEKDDIGCEIIHVEALDIKQMTDILKACHFSSEVAKSIADKIQWKKLSVEEICQIIDDSERNGILIQALSEHIEWKRFSLKNMQVILERSQFDDSLAEAMLHTGKFSQKRLFELMRKSHCYAFAKAVIDDFDFSIMPIPNMLDLYERSDNNGYVLKTILATDRLDTEQLFELWDLCDSAYKQKVIETIVKNIDWDTVSEDRRDALLKRSHDAYKIAEAILDSAHANTLNLKRKLEILKMIPFPQGAGHTAIEAFDWKSLSPEEMIMTLCQTKGNEAIALKIVETDKLFLDDLLAVLKLCGRCDQVASAVASRINWYNATLHETAEALRSTHYNKHICAASIRTGLYPKEVMFHMLEQCHGEDIVADAMIKVLNAS